MGCWPVTILVLPLKTAVSSIMKSRQVIPGLVKLHSRNPGLKIWVRGCSFVVPQVRRATSRVEQLILNLIGNANDTYYMTILDLVVMHTTIILRQYMTRWLYLVTGRRSMIINIISIIKGSRPATRHYCRWCTSDNGGTAVVVVISWSRSVCTHRSRSRLSFTTVLCMTRLAEQTLWSFVRVAQPRPLYIG